MQIVINISEDLYKATVNGLDADELYKLRLAVATGTIRNFVKNFPSVTPHSNVGCEGCRYEKTGTNSTYPCSHCSRCYTDKYTIENDG